MMKKRKSRTAATAAPKEELPQAKAAAGEEEKEVRETSKVAPETTTAPEEEGWRKRAGVMVSEQVPLGAMWLPSWDVGNMAESYVDSFYSDVWDGYDDIWGLRTPPSST